MSKRSDGPGTLSRVEEGGSVLGGVGGGGDGSEAVGNSTAGVQLRAADEQGALRPEHQSSAQQSEWQLTESQAKAAWVIRSQNVIASQNLIAKSTIYSTGRGTSTPRLLPVCTSRFVRALLSA